MLRIRRRNSHGIGLQRGGGHGGPFSGTMLLLANTRNVLKASPNPKSASFDDVLKVFKTLPKLKGALSDDVLKVLPKP